MFNLFKVVQDAGWPIWPLLFASVIALAIIMERSWKLRSHLIIPGGLLQKVLGELKNGGIDQGMVETLEAHSPLGRILAAGLKNRYASREVMKESIEEAGRVVSYQLEQNLTTLGTIASVAPLMGLFGTVVGMIEMFASQVPGSADPQMLAHGISIALYNAGFGILIAIPSMIFWRYFRAKIDGFVVEMEQQAIRLAEVLQGERKSGS
ncbi:MAG: MotA/TolQ/ExbB proton channel family protein [Betaproteobacteria bacterium]|nr:MotA/TolQ/ExbB proton channel family protein [Betaproteobacteria bacterium]